MTQPTASKAVVLLSGGLDSTTCLAIAQAQHDECFAISFNYGQKHLTELNAATRIAHLMHAKEHRIIDLRALGALGGSSLTAPHIPVPHSSLEQNTIPSTYVAGRNTIFLSIALSWAEILGAQHVFIGASAVDYSGYPDCRPDYFSKFQQAVNAGTKAGVEGNPINIQTPLLHLSKAETIHKGMQYAVDYSLTVSCYALDQEGRACGQCDSCVLRKKGFTEAGYPDPTSYVT